MSEEPYDPVPAEQRSKPPAGYTYPPDYVPADLDDWYPVHKDTGEPLPTALSGYRRLGGYYVPMRPKEKRNNLSALHQGTIVPKGFKPSIEKPVPSIRCTEIKEDGDRCGRWTVRGGLKCQVHSTNAEKATAAKKVELARLKLVGLADDAVEVLKDLVKPGTNDAIRLKAATEILDRAGVKGATDIKIEVEHRVDAGEVIRQRLEKMRANSVIEVASEIVVEDDDDLDGGEQDD